MNTLFDQPDEKKRCTCLYNTEKCLEFIKETKCPMFIGDNITNNTFIKTPSQSNDILRCIKCKKNIKNITNCNCMLIPIIPELFEVLNVSSNPFSNASSNPSSNASSNASSNPSSNASSNPSSNTLGDCIKSTLLPKNVVSPFHIDIVYDAIIDKKKEYIDNYTKNLKEIDEIK